MDRAPPARKQARSRGRGAERLGFNSRQRIGFPPHEVRYNLAGGQDLRASGPEGPRVGRRGDSRGGLIVATCYWPRLRACEGLGHGRRMDERCGRGGALRAAPGLLAARSSACGLDVPQSSPQSHLLKPISLGLSTRRWTVSQLRLFSDPSPAQPQMAAENFTGSDGSTIARVSPGGLGRGGAGWGPTFSGGRNRGGRVTVCGSEVGSPLPGPEARLSSHAAMP